MASSPLDIRYVEDIRIETTILSPPMVIFAHCKFLKIREKRKRCSKYFQLVFRNEFMT